jgi:hypothetical protein
MMKMSEADDVMTWTTHTDPPPTRIRIGCRREEREAPMTIDDELPMPSHDNLTGEEFDAELEYALRVIDTIRRAALAGQVSGTITWPNGESMTLLDYCTDHLKSVRAFDAQCKADNESGEPDGRVRISDLLTPEELAEAWGEKKPH